MKLIGLISILFVLIFSSSHASATKKSWNFDVYYDDKLIGEHTFELTKKENLNYIEINASFNVKFFFINAYTYRHKNKEVWDDQCLESIQSFTEDNGDEFNVVGEKKENAFEISVNKSSNKLDSCIQTFSYWEKDILTRNNLLNSQTGEIEKIETVNLGRELITSKNQQIMAEHFRLISDKFSIELWYSEQGEWLALRSTTEDGNVLTYKLKRSI